MSKFNGCEHCIPNKKGHRKALLVNTVNHYWDSAQINNLSLTVRDFITIDRRRKGAKQHVISNRRVKTERNPLKQTEYTSSSFLNGVTIRYCPVCGRDLHEKIPTDHPIRQIG